MILKNLIRYGSLFFLVPALVMILEVYGCFSGLSRQVYDVWSLRQAANEHPQPAVLLVNLTTPDPDGTAKQLIRDELLSLGARKVYFLGSTPLSDPILGSPVPSHGVYRSHLFSEQLLGELTTEESQITKHQFINFTRGTDSLPKVNVESLLSHELIPELVQGLVVLVGHNKKDWPLLATPVTLQKGMSAMEVHGHALNSLLLRRWYNWYTQLDLSLLLVAFSTLSLPVFLRFSVRYIIFFTGGLCALMTGAFYGFFNELYYFGPIVPLMFNEVLLLLVAALWRIHDGCQLLSELRVESDTRLSEHYWPSDIDQSAHFWEDLQQALISNLPLAEAALYECEDGKELYRLRERSACFKALPETIQANLDRCDTRASSEWWHRLNLAMIAPSAASAYSTAKVWPFRFGGEILGFMVFTFTDSTEDTQSDLGKVAREVCESVAAMLARRERKLKRQNKSRLGQTSQALLRPERRHYHQILESVDDVQSRVKKLEYLLEGTGSGVVVFDLFGRVLFLNESMRLLIGGDKITIFDVGLHGFLRHISDLGPLQLESVVRSVVFQKESIMIPVRFDDQPKTRFSMRLSMLDIQYEDSTPTTELNDYAVICEVTDISGYTQLSELKGLLSQRLGMQIRNDLGVIEMCSSILGRENLPGLKRQELLKRIAGKVSGITDSLEDCEKYLSMDESIQNREHYPVDSKSLLSRALADVKEQADERGVELNVIQPSVMSYAVASNEGLEDVFESVLKVLISDATDNGVVSTEVLEVENWIVHDMSNTGFGIPTERLQEYVSGNHPLSALDFQRLRQAAQKVKSWGGEFDAESELGLGMRFSVRLPRFL